MWIVKFFMNTHPLTALTSTLNIQIQQSEEMIELENKTSNLTTDKKFDSKRDEPLLLDSGEICKNCQKTYDRLLGHLSRSKICKSLYTQAELLEKDKERKRIHEQALRAKKSANEKEKKK